MKRIHFHQKSLSTRNGPKWPNNFVMRLKDSSIPGPNIPVELLNVTLSKVCHVPGRLHGTNCLHCFDFPLLSKFYNEPVTKPLISTYTPQANISHTESKTAKETGSFLSDPVVTESVLYQILIHCCPHCAVLGMYCWYARSTSKLTASLKPHGILQGSFTVHISGNSQ